MATAVSLCCERSSATWCCHETVDVEILFHLRTFPGQLDTRLGLAGVFMHYEMESQDALPEQEQKK